MGWGPLPPTALGLREHAGGQLLPLEKTPMWPLMATADCIIRAPLSSVLGDNRADSEDCAHSV